MNFKEMSLKEIEDFIKKEVPFDKIEGNTGVYETRSVGKDYLGDDITLGVTFDGYCDCDNNERKPLFIFNVFTKDEFIDLRPVLQVAVDDGIPDLILSDIKCVVCGLMENE